MPHKIADNALSDWAEWWVRKIEDSGFPSKTAEERWRKDGGISSCFFGPRYPKALWDMFSAKESIKAVDRVISNADKTILKEAVICRYFPFDKLPTKIRREMHAGEGVVQGTEKARALAFAKGCKSSVGTYRMLINVAQYLVMHEINMRRRG